MSFTIECLECKHKTPFHPADTACPVCGNEWRAARYNYAEIGPKLIDLIADRPFNLWRYRELLPIMAPNEAITMGEGGTPLIKSNNLALMLGLKNLYFKDERQGPTASFKDRQAALTITALKEAGITEAVIASTGNVAISYSAFAARAGIKLWAFLTSLVASEKMREVAIYGTEVIKVTGTYDQTKQVAAEFAKQRGFYRDRGTRSIPSVEAMKTLAYEIAEQFTPIMDQLRPRSVSDSNAPWRTPDWYIQAVSGGLGPIGLVKGLEELIEMGLIDKPPAIAAIQTDGCNPMSRAWDADEPVATPIESPSSLITTLSTGDPGRNYTTLYNFAKQHKQGTFLSVSDSDSFRAMHVLAKMEGLSVEPATAVAFAGLFKMVRSGLIKPDDVVVMNVTGHTMPIESHILGDDWARDVVYPEAASTQARAEDGLLAALSQVTHDRYTKILVVDDTADARRLIMRILQSQGEYELLQAKNGLEAIEISRNELPDLIILDLMMPGIDGFGVLDALKANQNTAHIPVIVVTAQTLSPQEKQRLSGRIQSLMQKGSFMDEDLLEEIKSIVA